MKIYTLISKGHKPDLLFLISDLIPVRHTKDYDFNELVRMIDYRDYYAESRNWSTGDYEDLYKRPECRGISLFSIRDTGVIVIPGNSLFPTVLKERDIK